jgi:sulfide dehydrogenase [flavocytochrome c] flavoprotein subunit
MGRRVAVNSAMVDISRRAFHRIAGVAVGALSRPPALGATPRVVIVGGGFGGASVAKYLRRLDSGIAVTLIEPKKVYHTCPFSSHVVAGLAEMNSIARCAARMASRSCMIMPFWSMRNGARSGSRGAAGSAMTGW